MTSTRVRMAELHTKQHLEGPLLTSLSTKTQVGMTTFTVLAYTLLDYKFLIFPAVSPTSDNIFLLES